MIKASKKTKAKLMIGHNRRFMSNVLLAKKMIDNGSLGDIKEYSLVAGAKFRWPTQTGFYFKKEEAGGGVLIDLGVHFVDQLLWFFGEIEDLEYQAQDTMGKGVEDNVFISFSHKNSIKGEFTLSRTEYLDNKLFVKGTDGWLKIDVFDTIFFELGSKKSKISKEFDQVHVKTKKNDPYRDQLVHFVDCINTDSKPLISGTEGMKAVEIVEKCYKQVLE
jgi:predicted dehydrogenase